MKVDQQCFLCCAKKAMSLLEQYQVPQEKAVRLMKEIYGGFSRADEEVSAPILMADMMGILDANVGICDAYGAVYDWLALCADRELYRLWSYGYRE